MFELHFGAEGPAAAEVVGEHEDGVREVEASEAGVVLVLCGAGVAEDVVGVEVVAVDGFAVAADGEARGGRGGRGVGLVGGRWEGAGECCGDAEC